MKSVIILLCSILRVTSLMAQTVTGVVRERSEGAALSGAAVHWKGTPVGITTDEAGQFSLPAASAGDTLITQFIGYETDTLVWNGEPTIEILMDVLTMAGVEVEGALDATQLNLLDAQKFQTLTEKELCKAACCSLAESFETNASIDASFTDAVSGTRQIKMLGLEGRYTQVLFDNIPAVRGLASTYGLTYVPGPWVKQISIAKGAGSVVSGFESMTGQINVAHKTRDMKERVFLNGYAGSQGRFEFNGVWNTKVNEQWNSVLLVHGAQALERWDMNNDGFLDNPLFRNAILRNEWTYVGDGGLRGEYALTGMVLSNMGGQFDYDPKDDVRAKLWGVNMNTTRADFSAKTGYVFPEKNWKSFGSQVSVSWHDQKGEYGDRTYAGTHLSARVNLLYASEISESSRFTTGISYMHDNYEEQLDSLDFDRVEQVPGAFFEYTLNVRDRLSVVAGLRGDYHNSYGFFATPRVHARYSLSDNSSVKIAAGKGYRSPNLLMDNVGMFASNRRIIIRGEDNSYPYSLPMEESWNIGAVFAQKFKLNYREASVSVDVFRTFFKSQVVVDWETTKQVSFYALEGQSYSNNVQAEFLWSPIRRMEFRAAYRWLDAKTDYDAGLLLRPMVAQHRAFSNLAYETKESAKGAKWVFDVTVRWLGRQRLPSTLANPHEYMIHGWGDDFWTVNAQVSYFFRKNVEVYIGGENLNNFMQMSPIISPEDPQSEYFDASLIWGPVFGRMGYIGFRWRIGGE